jgi:hypothetical protein
MSRANIVSMIRVPSDEGIGLEVTFKTREGELRLYLYEGGAAAAIMAGADPAGFQGTPIGEAK